MSLRHGVEGRHRPRSRIGDPRVDGPARYNCWDVVPSAPEHVPSRRRLGPLLVAAAALLLPWTLVLALRLPARHTTQHWDVAWVGFDVALAAALAATGWAIVRRATWATQIAAVAAT